MNSKCNTCFVFLFHGKYLDLIKWCFLWLVYNKFQLFLEEKTCYSLGSASMQVDIGFFFSDFFYKNIIFFNQLVFIKEKTLIRGVSGHFFIVRDFCYILGRYSGCLLFFSSIDSKCIKIILIEYSLWNVFRFHLKGFKTGHVMTRFQSFPGVSRKILFVLYLYFGFCKYASRHRNSFWLFLSQYNSISIEQV